MAKKRPIESLNKEEFEILQSTGMFWVIYPDGYESWEEMQKHIKESDKCL